VRACLAAVEMWARIALAARLAAAYAKQMARKVAKAARAVGRVLKKAAKVVGRAAVAVAKAACKYSGAQDVVSCVTHPLLSSCVKAAVTVALWSPEIRHPPPHPIRRHRHRARRVRA
jgi:hypothetical protein